MSQRPLIFIIPILPALSSVSGGQGRPPLRKPVRHPCGAMWASPPTHVCRARAPFRHGKSSFRGAQIPCKCPCGACENRLTSPPRPAEFTLYHSKLLQQFNISRKICRHARFLAFQILSANRLKSCEIFQNYVNMQHL